MTHPSTTMHDSSLARGGRDVASVTAPRSVAAAAGNRTMPALTWSCMLAGRPHRSETLPQLWLAQPGVTTHAHCLPPPPTPPSRVPPPPSRVPPILPAPTHAWYPSPYMLGTLPLACFTLSFSLPPTSKGLVLGSNGALIQACSADDVLDNFYLQLRGRKQFFLAGRCGEVRFATRVPTRA